jgi:hypothetical protein
MFDLLKWAIGQAGQDFGKVVTKRDFQTTAGFHNGQNGGYLWSRLLTTQMDPVLSSDDHHAFILPISGRKLKFTIVGTRFTADDCGCSTVNSALAAGSSMSKWRPAP